MTYINQERGMFRGQTLVTFRADDGAALVLEKAAVRYIDAADSRMAERIVPKQNAVEQMDGGERVVAARGNNIHAQDVDEAPLNGLVASYDHESGVLRLHSPYVDWAVDAGTEPRQAELAERFAEQVNAQVHAPKYVVPDYDAALSRAPHNEAN